MSTEAADACFEPKGDENVNPYIKKDISYGTHSYVSL